MRDRPTQNPPNRFASTSIEYDPGDGPPPSEVTLIEDHSRSILSQNDSPDLGFRWSVNPYRGCVHACAYCISGDTPILMGDGRTRPVAELRPGDEIYGTRFDGKYRRYTRTTVLDQWSVVAQAYRITLADGTELVASADHRFLTRRGWKFVVGAEHGANRRPHLTSNDQLRGVGRFANGQISRKRSIEGKAIKCTVDLRVISIEPVGEQQLYDIKTGTEDFIANGVVSHNCYARPTHEYLDLGAGTDFDTKIIYKPRAAELLREAFDKKSWTGERVMFSGVTDCYQPFEAKLRLTRACLEVCLDYRNPVGVISKSALIERDVDLFAELAREADARVTVSLAFADAETARAIEPWAPAPERRFKVIETLVRAGIKVGVMLAPIIPGLNDRQMIEVLERARAAGATDAGWTLLRLPGAVAQVFPERVRAALPLAADKILSRIRDTRGGERVNDSRFHSRFSGEGAYAQTIAAVFDATVKRLGMTDAHGDDDDGGGGEPERPPTFRRPPKQTRQLTLF